MTSLIPYLQLMRAPALFTAVSNIIAAHLVATGGAIQWPALIALCLASGAFLSGGMVINDCFDLAVDARERPGRPLPSHRISTTSAWSFGLLLLASGIVLAGVVGTRSLLVAVALSGSILLYNGVMKATWAGPLIMGLCRYLNWLLGLSVLALETPAWLLPLPVLLYVTSVTVLSRAEARALNRDLVMLVGAGLLLAGIIIVLLWQQGVLPNPWVLPISTVALAAVFYLLIETYRDFSPARIQATVGLLIFGIIPLDALLVVGTGIWWGVLLVLLMIPGRWLGRWLYVT